MNSAQIPSMDAKETPLALRRLAFALVPLLVATLASYAIPALQDVRPWLPSEGIPVLRLFTQHERTQVGLAETNNASAALGAGVAANLESGGGKSGPAAGPDGHGLEIAPSEYEGLTQPIENAAAIKGFFAKLALTAKSRSGVGAITRVAHYGDSAVAADAITSTARRKLQQRFGDAGHGFALVSNGGMHYIHRDVRLKPSDEWQAFSIVQDGLRDGFYGYGGVQFRGSAGASALIASAPDAPVGQKVARFELFFQKHRGGGDVRVSLDGKPVQTVSTRNDVQQDAWQSFPVDDGDHMLGLRVMGGEARIYGVTLERDVAGVVYDSLGLVGARADRLLNASAEHWKSQLSHRNPDLIVLGFGGNESSNAWLDMARYEADLVKVVRHVRAGVPAAACLLFAPLDQAERDKRGQIVTIEKLPQIVAVQRRIAAQEGCAFFDTFTAMGGEGSMWRWYKTKPRLATSDFQHATPQGYDVIGNMYYKALLKAFSEYLAATPRSSR